jgi:hypothetical protein
LPTGAILNRSKGALVGCPKYLQAKDVIEVVEYRQCSSEGCPATSLPN